jgi:hypothetical protein
MATALLSLVCDFASKQTTIKEIAGTSLEYRVDTIRRYPAGCEDRAGGAQVEFDVLLGHSKAGVDLDVHLALVAAPGLEVGMPGEKTCKM